MNSSENSTNSNIFSGMEHLGFENIPSTNLYEKKTNESQKSETKKEEPVIDEATLLYDKEQKCPCCESYFKVRAVKTNAPRLVSRDTDFYINYSNINPYFYDVFICPNCGYAAMKKDFDKLRQHQVPKIRSSITTKWKKKYYGNTYNVDVAIERFKLALLNYVVIEAKDSSKAMTCLKLAWMYRIKQDEQNENLFLMQALEGFKHAFSSEDFPIYSMDRYTIMYLIGELHRRVGDYDNALRSFSTVLTTPAVSQRLKDLTRDQKDLITKAQNEAASDDASAQPNEASLEDSQEETSKKKGFFGSFFKK